MTTIEVRTGSPYSVLLGEHLLTDAGKLIRAVHEASGAAIVTDTHVGPLYGQTLFDSLKSAGFDPAGPFTLAAGEENKQLAAVEEIFRGLAKAKIDRTGLVVALGGGVIGDMAGFAAACWMRGISFVQIPTSLLAMVDASVGGKTGVDIPEGKNLIGAFWQPALVIADVSLLGTLPEEYFTDGLGEVVKSACIKDADLFTLLETDGANADIEQIVGRCVRMKRTVVEADERERGERRLLNFGHTLGHALERYEHFCGISHGRAVSAGMALMTKASERAGLTEPGTCARLCALLEKLELPVSAGVPVKELLPYIRLDKKCAAGAVNLVVLRRIGEAYCVRVPLAELDEFFREPL